MLNELRLCHMVEHRSNNFYSWLSTLNMYEASYSLILSSFFLFRLPWLYVLLYACRHSASRILAIPLTTSSLYYARLLLRTQSPPIANRLSVFRAICTHIQFVYSLISRFFCRSSSSCAFMVNVLSFSISICAWIKFDAK